MKKSSGAMAAAVAAAILLATFIAAKPSTLTEKARDGRFVAYDNGTVLDTDTDLVWADKDNGQDISWVNAKFYCENYRGGGYRDWRLPTLDELESLYDVRKSRPAACAGGNSIHIATELIDISCFVLWTGETSDAEAAIFDYGPGLRSGFASQTTLYSRALPVRSAR